MRIREKKKSSPKRQETVSGQIVGEEPKNCNLSLFTKSPWPGDCDLARRRQFWGWIAPAVIAACQAEHDWKKIFERLKANIERYQNLPADKHFGKIQNSYILQTFKLNENKQFNCTVAFAWLHVLT